MYQNKNLKSNVIIPYPNKSWNKGFKINFREKKQVYRGFNKFYNGQQNYNWKSYNKNLHYGNKNYKKQWNKNENYVNKKNQYDYKGPKKEYWKNDKHFLQTNNVQEKSYGEISKFHVGKSYDVKPRYERLESDDKSSQYSNFSKPWNYKNKNYKKQWNNQKIKKLSYEEEKRLNDSIFNLLKLMRRNKVTD